MQPVVFSSAWFDAHQRALLAACRVPVLGREVRRALGITPHDVGWNQRIVRIQPHAYTVAYGNGMYTTDFRTHEKFAKSLRRNWGALWALAHNWDRFIANPLLPALNLGFDTLTVYPDPGSPGTTTSDGYLERVGVSEVWATIKAGAINNLDRTVTGKGVTFSGAATSGQWSELTRSYTIFDTSSLTTSAVISAATISLYGSFKQDSIGLSPEMSLNIFGFTPDSNTAPSTGSTFGATAMCASAIGMTAWSLAGYNDFALNATGLANISKTGVSSFSERDPTYDAGSSTPTWANNFAAQEFYHADQTGSANDPKLVVTFSVPGFLLVKN